MNGLAPTGMDPVSVLSFIAAMADSVQIVSGRPGVTIVVPTLEVLRPVFALLKRVPPESLILEHEHGWTLYGMSVVVDPHCPPETLYVLPA